MFVSERSIQPLLVSPTHKTFWIQRPGTAPGPAFSSCTKKFCWKVKHALPDEPRNRQLFVSLGVALGGADKVTVFVTSSVGDGETVADWNEGPVVCASAFSAATVKLTGVPSKRSPIVVVVLGAGTVHCATPLVFGVDALMTYCSAAEPPHESGALHDSETWLSLREETVTPETRLGAAP